jgi:flavin reductase (DIM6/NTAB) family NADH-FMN oxidoreductase RutF
MSLDKESFKQAMSFWASGVSVVTTQWNGENFGLTASSFNSVSLEPTLVSVNLAKSLYTHALVQQSGTFAVSILAADQADLGLRFAGLIPEIEDRFEGLKTKVAVTGCPILLGCLAWVDCRVVHGFEAGDHTIFVGEVLEAGAQAEGQPLLYYNRDWRYLGEK